MTARIRALELSQHAHAILAAYGKHKGPLDGRFQEARVGDPCVLRRANYGDGTFLEIWYRGEKVMGLRWGDDGKAELLGFDDWDNSDAWIAEIRTFGESAAR